jgi:hypothetical protein
MVRVDKHQIGNLLLVGLLSERNLYLSKIRQFENRHHLSFEAFEEKVNTASQDDFENWDDLIDWKANLSLLAKTEEQITDVRNGNIEMAE